jgi:hypothetical protein
MLQGLVVVLQKSIKQLADVNKIVCASDTAKLESAIGQTASLYTMVASGIAQRKVWTFDMEGGTQWN